MSEFEKYPRLIYVGDQHSLDLTGIQVSNMHCFVAAQPEYWATNENAVRNWLAKNMSDDYQWKGSVFMFKSEDDAVLFKLTWG